MPIAQVEAISSAAAAAAAKDSKFYLSYKKLKGISVRIFPLIMPKKTKSAQATSPPLPNIANNVHEEKLVSCAVFYTPLFIAHTNNLV